MKTNRQENTLFTQYMKIKTAQETLFQQGDNMRGKVVISQMINGKDLPGLFYWRSGFVGQ